ncbi:MAG: E3 ubiquitin protein ligase [Candidatus Heimdallarchaeota archaeon]|nr:E3 ubiquitin protein ligase [Candidatus Heimdallarchaeota archaeon]
MESSGYIIIFIVILLFVTLVTVAKRSIDKEKRSSRSKVQLLKKLESRNIPKSVAVSSKNTSKTKGLEWIKQQIMGDNENTLRLSMGYQFTISEGHKFDLFSRIKIIQESRRTIKVVATLRKVFPSYLDIRPANSSYGWTKDTFSVIDLNRYFKFYSTAPDMWREIFASSRIKDILLQNSAFLSHYYIRGEYLETVVSYDQAVISLLTMTQLIHQGLKQLFGVLDKYDVEKLVCYNCKDPFDPLEEICDKCESPRPRCIVCLLDLFPSEIEEEIVTTPCCGVYTHKDHMVIWLQQNPQCPNCHTNLSHWLGQLKIS